VDGGLGAAEWRRPRSTVPSWSPTSTGMHHVSALVAWGKRGASAVIDGLRRRSDEPCFLERALDASGDH